jgi:hypothetical protein
MKHFIAKVFGYLILFGSVLLKAPQIYNIFVTQTGDEISRCTFSTKIYFAITD